MYIKIPYSWVQDYLKTEAKPEEVFKLLTQTGSTVERVEKIKDDYILNIEVTINRPDCLSILGIAREMYVCLKRNNQPVKLVNDYLSTPPVIPIDKKLPPVPFNFTIDAELCPRFIGIVLKNIKISPSPQYITERLEKAGMRSLNNVIDITNFIMLELGQPSHAFDFNKIKGPKFIIRSAKKGETLITLDDKARLLDRGDIVYEDEQKIFDLSGIMGGKFSDIDNRTQNVFFTVAGDYFAQIRKTSMRLGIQTEASARLSKALDVEMVKPTFCRGLWLLLKYTQAEIGSQIFDYFPKPPSKSSISITNELIDRVSGISIPTKITDSILKSLGFNISRSKSSLTVIPPIWRQNDIKLAEDIIEEITRVYGYDLIPNQPPVFELPIKSPVIQKQFIVEDKIRHTLVNWGFTETLSYSMLSEEDLKTNFINQDECIQISNPLTNEWTYLQPCLLPNLIKNLSRNQNLTNCFFEIANVFNKKGQESCHLIIGTNQDSINEVKGVFDRLFESVRVNDVRYSLGVTRQTEPDTIEISLKNNSIGFIGRVCHSIKENYQTHSPITFGEINLGEIINQAYKDIQYHQLSPYTPIIEDLCLLIPPDSNYQQVYQLITGLANIDQVVFIDHYHNYYTFRLYYNLKTKQISSAESNKIRQELLTRLEKDLGVVLKTK